MNTRSETISLNAFHKRAQEQITRNNLLIPVSDDVFHAFLQWHKRNPNPRRSIQRLVMDGKPALPLKFAIAFTIGGGRVTNELNRMTQDAENFFKTIDSLTHAIYQNSKGTATDNAAAADAVELAKQSAIQQLTKGVTEQQPAEEFMNAYVGIYENATKPPERRGGRGL